MAEYTRQQIYRLCQQKDGVEVLELKVQPDHCASGGVHTAEVCRIKLHGLSEGQVGRRSLTGKRLGCRYWGRHLWSRGYCVSTSGLDEEEIRKYVKWQAQREKRLEATRGKLFE